MWPNFFLAINWYISASSAPPEKFCGLILTFSKSPGRDLSNGVCSIEMACSWDALDGRKLLATDLAQFL